MPGILPMKVIKVGTSAQSRIAQACDRCRSKKIRCDGITPCCSQCANVGFECKTSDKLSRRAFPRGYTESLEERVRALETEVKELKDLLDEKDEKIDILSRIHPRSPSSRRPSVVDSSPKTAEHSPAVAAQEYKDDTFRVQQSPCLLDGDHSDSFFMGASSGRTFIDTFKAKIRECGKPCSDFRSDLFFTAASKPPSSGSVSGTNAASKAPPRLVSDQMINIFFQEWAPLFPVLHRPTFLKIYTDYVANPEGLHGQQAIAQLNLVFGIAALSAEWNHQTAADFESQWQTAIDSIASENTLATLQCLVLAQIYCIAKTDYNKLLHYKGIAVGLSHRLGLHQSQKRFALGTLTSETRKKVFWTLYTLDGFSAALLGLPKLLNENDIYAEYPSDIDDENISERGFQSTLPGESTRLSSALALFRVSRILSKVLDQNYPAASIHDLSLHRMTVLNDELDAWLDSLAPHLRLQFVQDKPSTNVVGSRSPLLSLTYHYVRTLIHRPAVGSTLGPKASSSVVALAASSKHIIQIVQLLEERRMSFSFCLNKNELLLLSGFGLLFQGLDLDSKGKLIRDSQRLMCSVIEILERNKAPGAAEFKKVACAMISVEGGPNIKRDCEDTTPRRKFDGVMPAPKVSLRGAKKQIQAVASRIAGGSSRHVKQEDSLGRRATAPSLSTSNIGIYSRSDSQNSISSATSEPSPQYSHVKAGGSNRSPRQNLPYKIPNLDYLSFNNDPTPSPNFPSIMPVLPYKEAEAAYGVLQPPQTPYEGFFPSPEMLSAYISPSPSAATYDWASEIWAMPSDLGGHPASARSVLSFSEEELTSGEELSSCDTGGEYRGIMMPNVDEFSGLEGLEGTFNV